MSIVLSDDEIEQLTGYKWASRQLAALHKMGFWRARISPILPRHPQSQPASRPGRTP